MTLTTTIKLELYDKATVREVNEIRDLINEFYTVELKGFLRGHRIDCTISKELELKL